MYELVSACPTTNRELHLVSQARSFRVIVSTMAFLLAYPSRYNNPIERNINQGPKISKESTIHKWQFQRETQELFLVISPC